MSTLPAASLDLLVNPFDAISRIHSSFQIDEKSAENIFELNELWRGSIDEIALDETRHMAIVSATEPIKPDGHEFSNPFRNYGHELIAYARQKLGKRFLYFHPNLTEDAPLVQTLGETKILAKNDSRMPYDPNTLTIKAYGEYLGSDSIGAVNYEAILLASHLGVPVNRLSYDIARSLPLDTNVRRSTTSITNFDKEDWVLADRGYSIPSAMFVTAERLGQMPERSLQ